LYCTDFLVMVGAVDKNLDPGGSPQNPLDFKHVRKSDRMARALQPSSKGACGALRRWITPIFAALVVTACIPPSIEELGGGNEAVYIETNYAKAIPSGDHVTMLRGPGEFTLFQIAGVFEPSATPAPTVHVYWYVDWDDQNRRDPLLNFGNNFQYFACASKFDPADPSGQYPSQRKVLVVASTSPLQSEADAYLSELEDPSGDIAFYDWTIEFSGPDLCVVEVP